jgi:hypothetical protein
MRRLACILLAAACNAEVIDRIAVSVGNQVITEQQLVEEIRVTAFLNRQTPKFDASDKRATAERLIEQTLIKREMDLSRYPLPDMREAEQMEADLRKQYKDEAEFNGDLETHGVSEPNLKKHLWWQITTLKFIDYRFRPAVQIPDTDIRDYYDRERAGWEQRGVKPIPSLEDSRAEIEKILTAQRIDSAVDRWLGDTRTQVEILFRNEVFE